jgi:nucleoside-diphosphate-sugar epimerase
VKLCLFGGTAFLGKAIAETALGRGHEVTCAARGVSGSVPEGARHLVIDRTQSDAYAAVVNERFDAVVELTWQPGFAQDALNALSVSTPQWLFISSVSVYADHAHLGMDECSPVLAPFEGEAATLEHYGEAKVACEQAIERARGDLFCVVRPGLIGGPGDQSDRSGAWVARAAAAPLAPLLAPRGEKSFVQVLDVRDLAQFVVTALEREVRGTFNAVGDVRAFDAFIEESRRVGGHEGEVRFVDWSWLEERGINQWAGPESMACFVADLDMAGWGRVNGAQALSHGLKLRPLNETLADTLSDERQRGLDRPRRAGLSRERELQLLRELDH